MHATAIDKQGGSLRLDELETEGPDKLDRAQAETRLARLALELEHLQRALAVAQTHSVLVLVQGQEASGREGFVRKLMGALEPRHARCVDLRASGSEIEGRDFLWRTHHEAPRKGEFVLLLNSHYEALVQAKLDGKLSPAMWQKRCGHVRDFETLLTDHQTIVVKIFLHIDEGEQRKRLLLREEDPTRAWKLDVRDWQQQARWGEYQQICEELLPRTASREAPWWVVPAKAKWYRNLCGLEVLLRCLAPHREAWEQALEQRTTAARAALLAFRSARGEAIREEGEDQVPGLTFPKGKRRPKAKPKLKGRKA